MKKSSFIMTLFLAYLLFSCQKNNIISSDSIDNIRFQEPFKEDRATLFYSLNDSLDPELIRKQITEFANGGVGGVFFHAREGLLTQYFGKEWWDAIDAGVEECVNVGINPWFYDEYKWPSGYGAGYVPAKDEDYRGRYLLRIAKGKEIPKEGIIVSEDANYSYVCMTTALGNPWLNGSCMIDYLNPEAVKTFIEHTYQTYSDRNKNKYAMAGKGIFFDEPDILPKVGVETFDGVISYSPYFRETFLKEKGYDIADKFDCLFEEKDGYRKVRLDYWQIMGAQYEKAFVGQLGEFCENNNLILTGHFFPEETLAGCKGGIGNLMRQLRNEGMPGMDHLELRIDGGLNVSKSVSSVANQYGKERRMSELFGVSGQNMSFEDRKWIANWHVVLGINFFVEHLALYSMKGERKRDFPPAISYQQPWWSDNKQIEDYMGRLCYLSTLGKFAASTLLLVPIESEYIVNERESEKLFLDYYSSMETLMNIHCDFDLGDEQIIEEIGTVKENHLQIGAMEYEHIIIPELLTLRESTILKLIEFSKKGGKLIILGNYPRYVDGEPSHLLEQLKESALLLPNTKEELQKNIPNILPITHRPEAQIYTQKRILKGGEMLFITNLSRTEPETITLSFTDVPEKLMLWNPADGKHYKLTIDKRNKLDLTIDVAEFYVITTGNVSNINLEPELFVSKDKMEVLSQITTSWTGNKLDLNAITLDYASYSLDEGSRFSIQEPVIGIASRLNSNNYNGSLQLKYEIDLDNDISELQLVIESPSMYQSIEVNGIKIDSFKEDNFYWDHSFKKSENIASYLHSGKNTFVFKLDYKCPQNSDTIFANRYGTEIESIYLTGDFAVKVGDAKWDIWETEKNNIPMFIQKPVHQLRKFSLTNESPALCDDLTRCGYPFFAGKFEMKNSFVINDHDPHRRYYVNLPLSEAITYELYINEEYVDKLIASPFQWDITKYIKKGNNEIRFILCNSLRNLLGPHHHKGGELKGTSPLSFTGTGGWPHGVGDDYWYDLRLSKNSDLKIWTDDYNIIPFGFIKPVEICGSIQ